MNLYGPDEKAISLIPAHILLNYSETAIEKTPADVTPRGGYGYNRFLFEICRARPFAYLEVVLLSISGTLFAIISPLIMQSLIYNVLIRKNTSLLTPHLLAMAGIFFISAFFKLPICPGQGNALYRPVP